MDHGGEKLIMPTIARTKKYTELNLRFKRLIQLYAVMSELRLHTNMNVSSKTAKYYKSTLYDWSDYGHFLNASLNGMMQAFYIELTGFIGAYWDTKDNKISKPRGNDDGSLASYLYDGRRTGRKKTAQIEFEKLLENKASELLMIYKLRGNLAHFTKLKKRNESLAPGDRTIREILDSLAEVLYLLGFRRWNTPHYLKHDNAYTDSVKAVIDKLISHHKDSVGMRKLYTQERKKWYGK